MTVKITLIKPRNTKYASGTFVWGDKKNNCITQIIGPRIVFKFAVNESDWISFKTITDRLELKFKEAYFLAPNEIENNPWQHHNSLIFDSEEQASIFALALK